MTNENKSRQQIIIESLMTNSSFNEVSNYDHLNISSDNIHHNYHYDKNKHKFGVNVKNVNLLPFIVALLVCFMLLSACLLYSIKCLYILRKGKRERKVSSQEQTTTTTTMIIEDNIVTQTQSIVQTLNSLPFSCLFLGQQDNDDVTRVIMSHLRMCQMCREIMILTASRISRSNLSHLNSNPDVSNYHQDLIIQTLDNPNSSRELILNAQSVLATLVSSTTTSSTLTNNSNSNRLTSQGLSSWQLPPTYEESVKM